MRSALQERLHLGLSGIVHHHNSLYQSPWESPVDQKLGLPTALPVGIVNRVVPVLIFHQRPVDLDKVREIGIEIREPHDPVTICENVTKIGANYCLHGGHEIYGHLEK